MQKNVGLSGGVIEVRSLPAMGSVADCYRYACMDDMEKAMIG